MIVKHALVARHTNTIISSPISTQAVGVRTRVHTLWNSSPPPPPPPPPPPSSLPWKPGAVKRLLLLFIINCLSPPRQPAAGSPGGFACLHTHITHHTGQTGGWSFVRPWRLRVSTHTLTSHRTDWWMGFVYAHGGFACLHTHITLDRLVDGFFCTPSQPRRVMSR